MTITELRQFLLVELLQIGIEKNEAKAESELIIRFLSGASPLDLLRNPEQILEADKVKLARKIIERRQKREPLQYCLGESYFYGMLFKIRKGVLIPRADSEVLVESVSKFIERRALERRALERRALERRLIESRAKDTPLKLGEIGCGSGILSLALLKRFPHLSIVACDIEEAAVRLSYENACLHGLEERFTISMSDWKSWILNMKEPLDGLFSNPPYISEDLKNTLAPELLWEPATALFGPDKDGLGFYREFAALAKNCFSTGAELFFEFGKGQEESLKDIFTSQGWRLSHIDKDLNGISRVITLRPPESPF